MSQIYFQPPGYTEKLTVKQLDAKLFYEPWEDDVWLGIFNGQGQVLTAIRDFTLLGFAVGELDPNDIGTYWIHKVGVSREHQRRGLGRMLVERLKQEAATKGATKLAMLVPESFTDPTYETWCVLPWIQKLGFRAVSVRPEYFVTQGYPEDGIHFEKEII